MAFVRECPSGLLSKEQFLRIYEQFFPFGESSAFAGHLFRLYDTNQDGTIDFVEYCQGQSIISRGNLEEKLGWAFKLYDCDGDGWVSKGDMTIITEAIYRLFANTVTLPDDEDTPTKRVEKLFASLVKIRILVLLIY